MKNVRMSQKINNCISPEWEEISSGLPVEYFHQLIVNEYGSLIKFRLDFIKKCREKSEGSKKSKKKHPNSIIDVATNHGLKLRRVGKTYFTLCVFHSERTPSLVLYPTSNRYFCFGCGAKGDASDLEEYLKRS